MPYRNIVFIKLEKRLLNDPRWWTMSSAAQLTYVKLILLAAETYNKIPLNDNVLRQSVRSELGLKEFNNCLKEIKTNFPKFKSSKHFHYFQDFHEKTNYIPPREVPGKSQGMPKGATDQDQDQKKEKEKEKKPPTPKIEVGLFKKETEKKIKEKLAATRHHAVGSEANAIAFDKLVSDIAKDKTIKKPAAVALWRAGQTK